MRRRKPRRLIGDFATPKLISQDQSSSQPGQEIPLHIIVQLANSFPVPAAASNASSETSQVRTSSSVWSNSFMAFIPSFASGAGSQQAGENLDKLPPQRRIRSSPADVVKSDQYGFTHHPRRVLLLRQVVNFAEQRLRCVHHFEAAESAPRSPLRRPSPSLIPALIPSTRDAREIRLIPADNVSHPADNVPSQTPVAPTRPARPLRLGLSRGREMT